MFSACFAIQVEDDQVLDDIEVYFILINNQKITQGDFVKNDFRSELERQLQKQLLNDSGWKFDKA